MKKTIVMMFVLMQSIAWAADTAADKPKDDGFDKHKQMILQELDERISVAQTMKTCVSAAHGKEDLKVCREKHEKIDQDLKAKMKERRKQNIDENIKHLQDEKSKIETDKD